MVSNASQNVKVILAFLIVSSIEGHVIGPYQPQTPTFCAVSHSYRTHVWRLNCVVPNGKSLQYDDLNEWGLSTKKELDVTIQCQVGGKLSLSWPMKAEKIINLNVTGCRLVDFFRDMNLHSNVPDTLDSLSLFNCTVLYGARELFSTFQRYGGRRLNADTECGQQSLQRLVFRDVKYDYIEDPSDKSLLAEMEPYIDNFFKASTESIICNYRRLIYFDESISRSVSSYHFRMMTDSSLYPILQTYRTSDVGLRSIPEQLKNFRQFFPCLTNLDLANNVIENVNFTMEMSRSCPMISPPNSIMTTVNLRFNNVTSIPESTLVRLLQRRVIIDVRDNPINCAEQGISLKTYANQVMALDSSYSEVAFNLPCM